MTKKKEVYKIGNDVLIHGHIHDPENWLITCKKLGIQGATLCPIKYEKWQVLGLAKDFLQNHYERTAKIYARVIVDAEKAILDD